MKKVDQIKSSGEVVTDFDVVLSRDEVESLLSDFFDLVHRDREGFRVSTGGKEYLLLAKNITYLGHPHSEFKKRIQIPLPWNALFPKLDVLLVGIYTYESNTIFVFFDKKARGKSSSAHISSIDLQKAVEYGVFRKTDKNGNRIIACGPDRFLETFQQVANGQEVANVNEIEVFERFSVTLPTYWNGISAYREMIQASFANCMQGEWPGFYLEFRFENFLSDWTEYLDTCRYVSKKKDGDLDFDLEFPRGKFVGDLKTHSGKSSAVLGNDKLSVEAALKKYGRIWYVMFEFDYRMDRDLGCEVSHFWNEQIHLREGRKKDPDSYCGRMKHDGSLLRMHVMELNRDNTRYLSDFNQGRQSSGDCRQVKIKIDKKSIDNFVIFRKELLKSV